jgi:hypothetical protein
MPDPLDTPPGKITAFDSGQYDKLITWVNGVDDDLVKYINGPSPDVRIDATLGSGIHPGSPNWPPAKRFLDKATEFGKSWIEQSDALDKDWHQFTVALSGARDVFEDTNDLTNYNATTFLKDHPDVSGANGGPSAPPSSSAPPAAA